MKTTSLGLKKPDGSDLINIQDLNDNADMINAQLEGKAAANHSHNYAGSANAGGSATSALACTGNSATATKWASVRNINGLIVDGTANRVNYCACSTAAATAAKTAACNGFSLVTGAEITVKFTVANTAANPTLNVNSTGAKAIYYRGAAISTGFLGANRTYTFRYNGTQYELVGDINTDTNTTYNNFKGSTASATGSSGLVPAPAAGSQATMYLRADGTWQTPPNSNYTHPLSGVTAGTYRSMTVNAQGHVTAGTNPTTLSGYGISDAAKNSIYGDTVVNLGRKAGTSVGSKSVALGDQVTASGVSSLAEGAMTVASGDYSHAEGAGAQATAMHSHAEGAATIASSQASHAEGYNTIASGLHSHAEGGYNGTPYTYSDNTVVKGSLAKGYYSHAEGNGCYSLGESAHAEGERTFAGNTASHAEGSFAKANRVSSHAEGSYTTASGNHSHAEGQQTTASGTLSHAEGFSTIASGAYSHAEGNYSVAENLVCHAEGYHSSAEHIYSHAEGEYTRSNGTASHAEGGHTYAAADYSHAEGDYTHASNHASHAGGHYNMDMVNGGTSKNTTGTALAVGNGTSTSARSNAFSIMYTGVVKAKSTITGSTTADYAEFFEWSDGNPTYEDRIGRFVTLDGDKIRTANEDDDYILGIVSGEPFVLGNSDCDTWNGMYLRDEFNRTRYERAPKTERDKETGKEVEIKDADGKPVYYGTRPVLNPDYDPNEPYVPRSDRPEWSPIGMLGVLSVYDDGTCQVNGYCSCGNMGIATKADNGYRVIARINDNIVKVIFK